MALVQGLVQGGKPAVRVEGDVQLAADVNWLTDHVRWDVEADLARIVGDVPAHMLVSNGRKLAQALQEFVAQGRKSSSASNPRPPTATPTTESAP